MSTLRGAGATKALSLLAVAGVSLMGLAATGWAVLGPQGPAVHAGGFEAAASSPAVAPAATAQRVPAAGGYADLVEKVAPSIVTVRSERMVQSAGLDLGGRELPPFLRGFGLPEDAQPRRQSG